MKGHPEVVEYLKFLLRGELAARDQYLIHSRRYDDLGLEALYQRINHEAEEEGQHADALLRRILFLEGDPDMRPDAFEPGRTVEAEDIRRFLSTRVAKWWLPDAVEFVAELPHGATGKIAKQQLRAAFRGYSFPD